MRWGCFTATPYLQNPRWRNFLCWPSHQMHILACWAVKRLSLLPQTTKRCECITSTRAHSTSYSVLVHLQGPQTPASGATALVTCTRSASSKCLGSGEKQDEAHQVHVCLYACTFTCACTHTCAWGVRACLCADTWEASLPKRRVLVVVFQSLTGKKKRNTRSQE
jgi:hypothetical protein